MAGSILEVGTTELARHFGDYLARVRHSGDTVVVLKNKKAVAELHGLPTEGCALRSLVDLLHALPTDPDFASDIDAVNHADRPPDSPWD